MSLRKLALGVACLAPLPVIANCGSSSNWTNPPYSDDGGNSGSGGGSGGSSGGGSGGGSGGSSGGGSGGSSGGTTSACGGKTDGPVKTLDFSNNLIASPAPPGNLTAQNAPQIVVFGWDDIESSEATTFLDGIFNGVKNPDATTPGCTVNPNSCYGEGWNQTTQYACGSGDLSTARSSVLSGGCELGNHTFDHLENYEDNAASGTWSGPSDWPGIPSQYKDSANGGWAFNTATGLGPGVSIDQATWQAVITANDAELKNLYATSSTVITGFRAPRLEINDNGLNAIKAVNYQYDQDLEETQPDGFVAAAVAADTVNAKTGFNWFAWPYTLDNGSPGVWNQQVAADPTQVGYYVSNFPTGLWEVPVYEGYVPTADGQAVANNMIQADSSCTNEQGMMLTSGCYLAPGEVPAGSSITEVTGFDFNLYIYDRMTPQQWTDTMKHTFLLHYYGDRAPVTYGAHPVEYTPAYDNSVLKQANNYGYANVINYSTYATRQQSLVQFIQWIATDPVLSKDTFFMSGGGLVKFMQHPTDKTGQAVPPDTIASPDSNGIFTLPWTGSGATISTVSGNAANIVFNVASADNDPVFVSTKVPAGSLKNVSHIDIEYTSEVPFRIRLLTSNGTIATTALLAGVGGDRLARIRIKDFFPGPEATQSEVTSFAGPVDSSYMANVTGIQFESAATGVTGAKAFNTKIEQITLHGVATSALCN